MAPDRVSSLRRALDVRLERSLYNIPECFAIVQGAVFRGYDQLGRKPDAGYRRSDLFPRG